MFRALKESAQQEDPNHIFVISTHKAKSPLSRSKMQRAKSFARRFTILASRDGNNNSKSRFYTSVAVVAAILLFVHALSPSGDNSSSNNSTSSRLRFSSNNNNRQIDVAASNNDTRFSYSKIRSPYEEIWINSRLPGWAKKRYKFRPIDKTIPREERICYVHVGE